MQRKIVVQQNPKHFVERLNKCLDDMEAPISIRDRAVILSKMLGIHKHEAWSLLEGHQIPDMDLLQRIASEFEVDPIWLLGEK